jgi:hypothetical protein
MATLKTFSCYCPGETDMDKLVARAAILTLVFAAYLPSALAQQWPTEWNATTFNGAPSFDPCTDESGAKDSRDIVGNDQYPAMYANVADGFIYFRIRVDADASKGASGLKPFGWAVEIVLDPLMKDYEYLWYQ